MKFKKKKKKTAVGDYLQTLFSKDFDRHLPDETNGGVETVFFFFWKIKLKLPLKTTPEPIFKYYICKFFFEETPQTPQWEADIPSDTLPQRALPDSESLFRELAPGPIPDLAGALFSIIRTVVSSMGRS